MDGVKYRKPYKCPAPEYIDSLMSWIEQQINDSKIFPQNDIDTFSQDFKKFIDQGNFEEII